MDNAAFRSLVSKSPQNDTSTSTFKKPATLGSRARSLIPMTPRNVHGYSNNREFARQVAEHTSSNGEPPLKKFKSSAAPKGTKLGAGYVDRASIRKELDEDAGKEGDKAARLKNLEEQLKLGQIDQAQFERLRDQIGVGGDVSSTHLVKGLDWKLLERVRRGEDVDQSAAEDVTDQPEHTPEIDVDEELERALEKDVVASKHNEEDHTVAAATSEAKVMTRDEILRKFREQRGAPATPSAPVLNDKFKKVAASEKSGKRKFIESVNGRRREVLVITIKDGTTKRKTRWIDPENAAKPEQQTLGMEVPVELAAKHKATLEAQALEDENEDIFAEAGGDYNPLAGIDSGSEESGEDQIQPSEAIIPAVQKRRNYFSTGNEAADQDAHADTPASRDPTILAALKRAAQLRKREEESVGESEDLSTQPGVTGGGAKSSAFLAKVKEQERQDDADFDYGFGESRFGDDDDEDAGPLYDDEDGDKKKTGRKRGPKKRKGNKDNVQDVMSVLEGRNKKS